MTMIADLPPVRGRYREHVCLAETTWFRVGGVADVVFKPADPEDLAFFLREKAPDIPVTILGAASNVVVRDGGLRGVVIRLGRGFNQLAMEEEGVLLAGAANLDVNVAQFALKQSVKGLEFLSGIPGTIGGALRMNAGAYGREVKDCLIKAEVIFPDGSLQIIETSALGLSYRTCSLPEGSLFTRAWFFAVAGNPAMIAAEMQRIQASRQDSQPIRARTGGSTFKNPPGQKAWELIDAAGGRGMMRGGAQVSEKHCNFLINTGTATAADLERLTQDLIRQVYEHSGITLTPEIRFIGEPCGKTPN